MKKVMMLLLIVSLMISSLLPFVGAVDSEDDSDKTVILYTGNVRGDIDVYSKIATLKAEYEAKNAEVILADAGNCLQGSADANTDRGLSVYQLMDAVGYDVAAMGMYDFSYGDATTGYVAHGNFRYYYTQAELLNGTQELTYSQGGSGAAMATRPAKDAAGFKVVSANIDGEEAYYSFRASEKITTQSGLEIVFFGLTDEATASNMQDVFFDGYTFVSADTAATRAGAADIVVCLSNATGTKQYGDIHIEAATNADLIAGAYVIDNQTREITAETINLSAVAEDPQIAAAVANVKANADAVVGTSDVVLNGADSRNWNGETNLGDLTADALKWYAENYIDGIDKNVELVAIQNGGNCDNFIYPGDITRTDLLRALPFSPMGIGVLYVTGAQLLETIEAATQSKNCRGWAQVAGIEYTVKTYAAYDAGEAYGNFFVADSINRVEITSINGKEFNETATYAVVADNFLLNGNDTYYVFKSVKTEENYINNGNGTKTRDAVALYIQEALSGNIGEQYATEKSRITIKQLPFKDVAEGKWYYNSILFAYHAHLFNGTSENEFSPELTMTRAMMVTVLYRLAAPPPAGQYENTFSDVAEGSYYEDAVAWAAANEVVNGVGGNQFDPDGNVTREQMTTIFYRYARYKGYDTTAGTELEDFADCGAVSAYARSAMQWAVAEKLIQGVAEGGTPYIQPQGNATRAQVATVFQRFVEYVAS